MSTIDNRSLTSAATAMRCPHCGATDICWFGVLRICAACRNAFHWRAWPSAR